MYAMSYSPAARRSSFRHWVLNELVSSFSLPNRGTVRLERGEIAADDTSEKTVLGLWNVMLLLYVLDAVSGKSLLLVRSEQSFGKSTSRGVSFKTRVVQGANVYNNNNNNICKRR